MLVRTLLLVIQAPSFFRHNIMKRSVQSWLITCGSILCNLFIFSPAQAQIISDTTLPNNSSVIIEGSTSNITGGTQAGTNLFHSFKQFSLPTGATAYFTNGIDIQNIFARVTSGSISNIDGTLKANGNANLFLLNPTGIIFGPNVKLNIGGSFIGSTASTINFADGNIFNTRDTQTAPLLTISVPVGLGFGGTPAPIRVLGNGHNVLARDFQQIERNNPIANLQVEPQKMLAIVGGNVSLEGGILIAEGGRIELGGVEQGLVKLNPTSSSWNLSYEGVSSFRRC